MRNEGDRLIIVVAPRQSPLALFGTVTPMEAVLAVGNRERPGPRHATLQPILLEGSYTNGPRI